MNIILSIIILVLLIYLILNKKEYFNIQRGVGRSFSYFYPPYPPCKFNNNCFPGYYYRSQYYNNMCMPRFGALTKDKIQLRDGCLRSL